MTKAIQIAPGLTKQVYEAILDEICGGALAPGTRLVQEQLAERLGVSRQPIQQAIALLKADGMVEAVGRRGLYVAELDLTLMHHHCDIRAALDGLAARTAATRAREDAAVAKDLAKRGRILLSAGEVAIKAGAIREQIQHYEALHVLLYEASGNPLLTTIAEPNWRFLRRIMGEILRHAKSARAIWQQHTEILDAVVAGKPRRAEEQAVNHVRLAADALAKALPATARSR